MLSLSTAAVVLTVMACPGSIGLAGAEQTAPPAGTTEARNSEATSGAASMLLAGCFSTNGEAPHSFFFADEHHSAFYQLMEKGMGLHIGRQIRVIGALLPTPNFAAQAGSIDSSIIAIASSRGNQVGATPYRPKPRALQLPSVRAACSPP